MEQGATLVLVSHDPTAIERVCDRVVVVDARAEGVRRAGRRGPPPLSPHARHGDRRVAVAAARRRRGRDAARASSRSRTATVAGATCSARASRCARELVVDGQAERAVLALEVRDQRGELVFRTDQRARRGRRAARGELRRSSGWRSSAATTTWLPACSTRTRRRDGCSTAWRASRSPACRTARASRTCAASGALPLKPEDAIAHAEAEAARKRAAGRLPGRLRRDGRASRTRSRARSRRSSCASGR